MTAQEAYDGFHDQCSSGESAGSSPHHEAEAKMKNMRTG